MNKELIREKFEFSEANKEKISQIIKHYPAGKEASAVIAVLDLGQRQNDGWVSQGVIEKTAEILSMSPIKVYEIASFYSMFNLKPVGKYHIQICGTTPCWLRGSDVLFDLCHNKLGLQRGETTVDGKFTLYETECLGACVNGPVAQINDDYYEDLDSVNFAKLLDDLAEGKEVTIGSQIGRKCSAPKK